MWRKATRWAGRTIDGGQLARLDRYRNWLLQEAVAAGGIGPGEQDRIDTRHIAESLLFSFALTDVSSVVDLGTGVGLPGIPLAIVLPDTEFVLVDRSQRRVDLTRRVVRILGLENVQVFQGEIGQLGTTWPALVSRATVSPKQMRDRYLRYIDPAGVMVLGGSWVSAPQWPCWETVTVPQSILDHEVWLLIMRHP